jgi:hypothetical protein
LSSVLLFNLDTKLQSSKATSVYPVNIGNYAFSSVIEKSKNFKSSQKSGYDLETTSAFSIIIGTLALKEQMPFYGHYRSQF